MTTYTIKAPNGVTYEIEGPEGASQAQVAQAVLTQNPEASKPSTAKGGFKAAFGAGVDNLQASGAALLGRTGVIDNDTAEQFIAKQRREAAETFKGTEDGWTESPWTKFKETLGGSLPYMAAPVVAGGAAVLGAPALGLGAVGTGIAATGAAGLASGAQFTGTNLDRQMETGKALKDTNLTNAMAAAAPQAALDMLGLGKIPGVRQLIGMVAKDVGKDAAVKIAGQTGKQAALDYMKATGTAMSAEGITEAAQQVLERMQAGLNITDADARKEYWDSLIGGAVMGGALAPAGRFVERGQIEGKQAEQAKVERTEADAAQLRQSEFDAIDARKEKEAEEAARPTNAQLWEQHDVAEAAKVKANTAADAAIANKDYAAAALHMAEFDKQEAAQQEALSRTQPREQAAPPPQKDDYAALTAELTSLEDTANGKGKRVKGLIAKLHGEGDRAGAIALMQRADEIKKKLGVAPEQRQLIDKQAGRIGNVEDEYVDTTPGAAYKPAPVAEAPAPAPVAPAPEPMKPAGQLSGPTREQQWREAGTAQEIQDMAANRLDTSRTAQTSLLDEVSPAARFVDSEGFASDTRQALIFELQQARRDKDRKGADIALEKLRTLYDKQQKNQSRMGTPDSRNPLPVVLGENVKTGPSRPAEASDSTESTPTPKNASQDSVLQQMTALPPGLPAHHKETIVRLRDNMSAIAQDPAKLDQVAAYLHGLRTRRAEQPVADAGYADNFRSRDMEGMLDTLEQGKRSETEIQRTEDGGKRTVTAQQKDMFPQEQQQGKLYPTPEAFEKFLGSEALNKLRTMLGISTQTVQRAMKKIVPLQKRIDQLTDSVAAERDKYERTKQYGEVMAADADAKHEAAQARFDAVIQRLDAELVPLQADYLKAQTELKEAVDYAKDINETIAANRAVAGPAAIQKIQHFQTKLAQELKAVEQLSVAFVRAKSDLERVAKNQKQRVTTQRAMNEAAGETFDAAKERVETVQGTRDTLQGNQERRQGLRAERGAAQKQVDDIMRPVNEARDARLPKAADTMLRRTPEDTVRSQERDAASGARNIEEQARRERLDAIPGERVDNSKYRKARDAAPPDQLRAERMALLEEKALDESLPKTTRDAAARQVRKMKIEDSATESRSKAQVEFDRLTDTRIPELRQQVADAPSTSNKQELARAVRAAKKLGALLQRAKRTDVAEKTNATEPVEEGTRLERPGRANVATRKEITPGEQRTGSAESIAGENKTGNANRIKEKRVVQERNTAVGRKEQQQANDEAATLMEGKPDLSKSTAEWFEETTKAVRTQLATLRTELEEANAKVEDIKKRPTKYSPEDRTNADRMVSAIESEIESAQTELEKREASTRGEDGPSETLSGKNVTTLFGTDWAGEREAAEIDGNAVFRTAKATGPGMKSAEVARVANRAMEGWTNAPEVTVVERESDLPQRIQDQAKRDNMTGKIPGLFDPETGSVFLVAENLHNGNDVALTIAHEVAGHYGLRDMMGADYDTTMNRLYNGNADIKAAADARMKESPNLSKEVAVEEGLAEMAESTNAKSGVAAALSRAYFAMKSWFAKRLGLKNVSDAEVRQIVANARRHVKRGERNGNGPGGSRGSVYRSAPQSLTHEGIGAPRLFTTPADTRSMYQRVTDGLGMALETGIVDMHAPLFRALEAAGGTAKKATMQAMYMARKANQSINVVQQSLSMAAPEWGKADKRGLIGPRAGDGPSGADVLATIQAVPGKTGEDKIALATEYLAALRAVQKGGNILGEGGYEKAKALIAAVKRNPEAYAALEVVRAKYKEYNTKLIHFARDSGAISAAEAKDYLQGDYVPMYRNNNGMLELSVSDDRFVSMGDIKHTPFLHALKGSDAAIMPLNESIVYNTKLLVDMALSNMQKRNIAYAMNEVGVAANKKGVMRLLPGQGDAKEKRNLSWREEPTEDNPEGHRHLIVDTEGTSMEGVPTDVLANALEGFHATMPAYVRWSAIANDYLRAGVTRTPVYVFRQLMRDPMAAASVTGLRAGPFRAVFNTLGNYANAYKTDAKNFDELNRRALVQSNVMTGDIDDMAKLGLQIGGPDGVSATRKFLNILDRSAHNADAATRLQIWEDSKAQELSDIEAEYRVMESMNFHKRGAWETVQHANRILPFFNSAIQGLNVSVKALQGKMPYQERLQVRRKFVQNAMVLSAAGFAYAAAMGEDEEYSGLAPEDKIGNLHIPLPGGGFFKMPLGYVDSGGLAWAMGQYLVEQDRDDTDAAQINKALGKYMLTAVPGGGAVPLPPVLKQVVEGATNTDLRTFRPIVGKGLSSQTPDQQYNASTLESYKAIGAAIGVSPIKLQRSIDTLFSSTANGVLGLLESVVGAGEQEGVEKATKELSRMPFISSFTQNDKSSGAVSFMYDKAQGAVDAKATLQRMKNEGRSREDVEAYFKDNRTEIALAPMGKNFVDEMARLSKAIKQTREAQGVSGDVKAERIKGWEKQQRDLAEKFKERLKAARDRLEATAA